MAKKCQRPHSRTASDGNDYKRLGKTHAPSDIKKRCKIMKNFRIARKQNLFGQILSVCNALQHFYKRKSILVPFARLSCQGRGCRCRRWFSVIRSSWLDDFQYFVKCLLLLLVEFVAFNIAVYIALYSSESSLFVALSDTTAKCSEHILVYFVFHGFAYNLSQLMMFL